MKAIMLLQHFLTLQPSPAKHSASVKLEAVVEELLDELFSSLHLVHNKTEQVHICQRALQRLLVHIRTRKPLNPAQLQLVNAAIYQLRDQLPQYFNWNEQAVCTQNIFNKFNAWSNSTGLNCHPLLSHLIKTLHQDIAGNHFTWLHLKAIEALISINPDIANTFDPIAFAVEHDLCIPAIKNDIIQYYHQQISNADAPAALIKLLLQQVNFCIGPAPQMYVGALSLQEHLLNWLNQELNSLQTSTGLQPVTVVPLPKIATPLSVSQLAAFLRLVIDTQVITCTNQRQLLSFIAAHVQTAKAADISPQSFRNKYYGPELSTISVVKDICINMLNRARKMTAA